MSNTNNSKSHVSTILMQSIFLEDHGSGGLKVTSCPLDESGAMLFAERTSLLPPDTADRADINNDDNDDNTGECLI